MKGPRSRTTPPRGYPKQRPSISHRRHRADRAAQRRPPRDPRQTSERSLRRMDRANPSDRRIRGGRQAVTGRGGETTLTQRRRARVRGGTSGSGRSRASGSRTSAPSQDSGSDPLMFMARQPMNGARRSVRPGSLPGLARADPRSCLRMTFNHPLRARTHLPSRGRVGERGSTRAPR
jgi:hypothetical protein